MTNQSKPVQKMDPALLARERAALRRTNRKVLLFNEREQAAIDEYCRINRISAKAPMLRKIIMEKILGELGENPPSLF